MCDKLEEIIHHVCVDRQTDSYTQLLTLQDVGSVRRERQAERMNQNKVDSKLLDADRQTD